MIFIQSFSLISIYESKYTKLDIREDNRYHDSLFLTKAFFYRIDLYIHMLSRIYISKKKKQSVSYYFSHYYPV